jgi:DNA-binding NarL/FixJ family response regulator
MPPTRGPAEMRGVFLIGDRPLCRHGMAQVIGAQPDLSVCGEAADAREAISALNQQPSALAVLDLSAEPGKLVEVVEILHGAIPDLPILVIGAESDPVHALGALRAGAKGFITKQEGLDQFVAALRKIGNAEMYLSPVFSEQLITELAGSSGSALRSAVDRLTGRELEVLRLLGGGAGTRVIAKRLGLSAKTVETHRARIKEKLGIRTATQLLRFAMQWTSAK